MRWFLAGSLILLLMVQALGQTHVSRDAPGVNSENLLVILAPLVFAYGAAMFYTLLDQLRLSPLDAQGLAVTAFVVILCAPLLFALLVPLEPPADSPYSSRHIQQTAGYLPANESMMSDIPGGVAWYGDRSCLWLPLDDDREFFNLNALKPVHGLFLTQVTSDAPFLSQMRGLTNSWGSFLLGCAEHGEVPTGFPLRKAPVGLLPAQLFLSDKARWREAASPR
jgi:hypothetical protein